MSTERNVRCHNTLSQLPSKALLNHSVHQQAILHKSLDHLLGASITFERIVQTPNTLHTPRTEEAQAMCIYHTFHWSCCPGAAAPAPYYLHQKCPTAEKSLPAGLSRNLVKRCKIEHRILDGADHDEPCPRCGCVTLTPEEQTLMRDFIG
jgi:hypothetical protein